MTDFGSFERAQLQRILSDLIKIDTSNPPGNETEAALYLKNLFDSARIDSEIIEPAKGRGNFVAKLEGDLSGPSLLLLSHLDVVPATDIESWKHPPFAGLKDGSWIYGRDRGNSRR